MEIPAFLASDRMRGLSSLNIGTFVHRALWKVLETLRERSRRKMFDELRRDRHPTATKRIPSFAPNRGPPLENFIRLYLLDWPISSLLQRFSQYFIPFTVRVPVRVQNVHHPQTPHDGDVEVKRQLCLFRRRHFILEHKTINPAHIDHSPPSTKRNSGKHGFHLEGDNGIHRIFFAFQSRFHSFLVNNIYEGQYDLHFH